MGFNHPWVGKRTNGTAENKNSGCCGASSFTVMDYWGDTTLSADDRLSLERVLSKRSALPLKGQLPQKTCRY